MIETLSTFTAPVEPVGGGDGSDLLAWVIGSEIYAMATADQAEGFFLSVGQRLARLVAMDEVEALAALETRANLLWHVLGWGEVHMTREANGVRLQHRGLPRAPEEAGADHWPVMLRTILRGAYDTWFRALGSGETLHTRIVQASDKEVELHHGI